MEDRIFYNEGSAAKLGWTPNWFGCNDFDEDLVNELRKRATEKIKAKKDKIEQENSLSNFKILSKDSIKKLASNDINNREDLADLSVDELLEMIELSQEDAGKLIMDAREPWFNQD